MGGWVCSNFSILAIAGVNNYPCVCADLAASHQCPCIFDMRACRIYLCQQRVACVSRVYYALSAMRSLRYAVRIYVAYTYHNCDTSRLLLREQIHHSFHLHRSHIGKWRNKPLPPQILIHPLYNPKLLFGVNDCIGVVVRIPDRYS